MKKHAKPHRKPKQEVTTVGCMDDKKQGYEKEHHSLLTRSEINWTECKTRQITHRDSYCPPFTDMDVGQMFAVRIIWCSAHSDCSEQNTPLPKKWIYVNVYGLYSNGKRSQIFLRQSTDEQQGAWLHIVHCTRCIWPYTMTLQGGVKKTMKHYQQYVPLRKKWPISCFWQWTVFFKFHELPANQIVKELNILK